MGRLTARPLLPLLRLFFVFGTSLISSSSAIDTVERAGSVNDGETLVSADGSFLLGFFSVAGGSTKRYLCIRYTRVQEQPIVWVANREQALNGSGGVLRFGGDGNLVVLDAGGGVVWSTGLAPDRARNRVAKLLDNGNLVVGGTGDDLSAGRFLWQSYDVPGNTLLPGMEMVLNTRTGVSRHLTSWKSVDDPSPGRYTYRLDVDKLPRMVVMEGSTVKFSTGPWIGDRFTGTVWLNVNGVYNSSIHYSGDEVCYTETTIGNSTVLRFVLTHTGEFRRIPWGADTQSSGSTAPAPAVCEWYGFCGPFGVCTEGFFPYCQCPRGFRPRSQENWDRGNTTEGCVRNTALGCGGGGTFLNLTQMKLPELDNAEVDMGISVEECRDRCARNCSCTAYGRADYREGGRGCIIWSGAPLNMKVFNNPNFGQLFYLRISPSDLDQVTSDSHKKSRRLAVAVSASVVASAILLALCGFRKKRKTMNCTRRGPREHRQNENAGGEETEVTLFDYETLTSATNNFSVSNKLGEGGFGVVYKGTLTDGQEIAVKRLLHTSTQGISELMNEIKLMVRLQHKNLVRLLGCCVLSEEKMLIYEYMQNKSLDFFIFDERKRALLSWRLRLDIIWGIARGLVYLHHDSRLKIVHRDLKAGNILLDDEMNPKISDFGTARIFQIDQLTENTKRVIGTYGYMSPEYAMNGIISIKSDVFSFGVIILEILSGIKNRGIYPTESHTNLLSHVWKLWQEGNGLQLLDPMATSMCDETELLRRMQIALLCVQERASDRPTMLVVLTMLSSENVPLPQPKRPGFLILQGPYSEKQELNTNEMTNTCIIGR